MEHYLQESTQSEVSFCWAVIEFDSDWSMLIIAFLSCLSCYVCVQKAYLDGRWRFVISGLVIFVIRYPLFVISSSISVGKNVVARENLFVMSKDAPKKVSFVFILKVVGVR